MNSYSFFTVTTYVTLAILFTSCVYGQTVTQEATTEKLKIDTARNLNLHDITQALYAHDAKKVELLVADYIPTHEELEKYYSLALKQIDTSEQLLKTCSTLKWMGICSGVVIATLALDTYLINHDRETILQKKRDGDTRTISSYTAPLWTIITATAGCIKVFSEFRRYRHMKEQRTRAYECLRVIGRTRSLSLKN